MARDFIYICAADIGGGMELKMPIKFLSESKGYRYYISLAKELTMRYIRHNIGQTGGQLAYFSLLSLFPFIIYINTLITAINIPSDRLITILTPILPNEIANMIGSYVEYISDISTTKLLSIGILLTLYSASRSVRSIEKAINAAYDIIEQRRFIRSTVLSMLFILFFGIVIIIVLLLSVVTKNILANIFFFFGISQQAVNLILFLKWAFIIISLFFTIASVYYFIPNKKIKIRSVLPGTILSMVCFAMLSIGFSIYVNNFARFSVLYGSIGALFLLMLWLYIAGIILVLGAELNAVLE